MGRRSAVKPEYTETDCQPRHPWQANGLIQMKILSVHNSYQTPGGEDQVFAQEADLLRSHGHQVLLYQASNDQVRDKPPLVLLGNTIWNRQIHRELRALIHQERPEIVHVHNTFPVISPAAYYAAKEEGIPLVQTLHNYRPLCPAATLFRDGHVCEDCVGKRVPWPGVAHGCYRGSRLATASGAAMLTVHDTSRPGANPSLLTLPLPILLAENLSKAASRRRKSSSNLTTCKPIPGRAMVEETMPFSPDD